MSILLSHVRIPSFNPFFLSLSRFFLPSTYIQVTEKSTVCPSYSTCPSVCCRAWLSGAVRPFVCPSVFLFVSDRPSACLPFVCVFPFCACYYAREKRFVHYALAHVRFEKNTRNTCIGHQYTLHLLHSSEPAAVISLNIVLLCTTEIWHRVTEILSSLSILPRIVTGWVFRTNFPLLPHMN